MNPIRPTQNPGLPMLAPHGRPADLTTLSDDELVERARDGDSSAYGELWRRHSGIGTSIARRYYEIADADDLVSEAFARILTTMQRGGGPRSGFRPYLITTIGNVARRWATRSRDSASDDLDLLEDPKTLDDPVVAATDQEFALQAFKSLPERWQSVLWYSAVEGMGPTEVAGYLGMSPNAAAVLAHRARAGLRTAWVQAHLNDATLSDDCRWTAGRLGRHASGALSARERARVTDHLATCKACRARARELDQLTSKLAVLLVPALLGLGASLRDSNGPITAAAIPPSELAGTALAPAHAWLAGIAVAVVTATAFITASAPPEATVAETAAAPIQTPRPTTDSPAEDLLPTLGSPADPSAGSSADDVPTGSATEPLGSATPPASTPPIPVAPPPAAPAVPVVTTAIDPYAVVRPSLEGTALPGAQIVVTDELGTTIATVVADAAGAWSTGQLASLSPAAAAIEVRQIDDQGRASAVTTVDLAPMPLILSTLPNGATYADSGFELVVVGWPGSTVQATFSPATSPDWPDYLPAESTYPDTVVAIDWQGLGSIWIDSTIPGGHRVDLRYTDGVRSSTGVSSYNFVVWLPD